MKIDQLKKRLDKDRKMTSITLRMPVDVVDDLKESRSTARLFWLSGIT